MNLHCYDPEMACRYGLTEAIFIRYFKTWIERNRTRKQHQYEEHTWTYNSVQKLKESFPYFSIKQIRYAIDSLVRQKVLLKGRYNRVGYDRTTWYAFADEPQFLYEEQQPSDCEVCESGQLSSASSGKSICQKGQIELSESADRVSTEGEPIPSILHIDNSREEEGHVSLLPPPIKKATIAVAEATPQNISERRATFEKRMKDYQATNPSLYPMDFYELFFNYWTQPSADGMLLKFEAENFFGIELRMANFWRRVSPDEKKRYWSDHHNWLIDYKKNKKTNSVDALLKHASRSTQPELFKA